MDTPVKHYSSGMYVRLAFAVAAHLEPEILLVDEVLALWNRPSLQSLSWNMTYSTGLAFEPVQEETNEYASSCSEKGRGSTSATLEGRNRYR